MSSEQPTSHRSPLRVSCCFATSLSFVIVVAIFFVTLVLKLRPGGGSSYTVNPDSTVTDRTVRLIALSLIPTAHSNGRSFSTLCWSQRIFLKPLCSWSGSSTLIPARLIVQQLTSSLTREPFYLWFSKNVSYE